MAEKKLKAGDKVVREGTKGPVGVIQNIRMDTTRASLKEGTQEAPGETVTVLWDNGTTSHLLPDNLKSC